MSIRKIMGMLGIGLFSCMFVFAQEKEPPEIEEITVDTSDTVQESVPDSTKVQVIDYQGKTRQERWQEAIHDHQKLGEWSEESKDRLTLRPVPDEAMKKLRDMKALQYDRKEKESEVSGWVKQVGMWIIAHTYWIRNFYYITLAAIFLLVVIFFLRKSDLQLFGRRNSRITEEEEEQVAEGPQNYEALAREAIAAGDYRQAIRMRYLHTLHILQLKQLIIPGKDKTNMEFLRELSTTAFYQPFSKLTRHYEYIWYGKVPVSSGQFAQLDEQFAEFKKSLK